jgi:hypothetical protein
MISFITFHSGINIMNTELDNELLLEGWKEAAIAWAVCESIHREYANGKDPFYTTRQADYAKARANASDMYKLLEIKLKRESRT